MDQPERTRVRLENVPSWLVVTVVTAFLLLPFMNKSFNIDDPLFIWAAKQIVADPLDFYGFDLNWYGCPQSMAQTMLNPPLTSYYLAMVGQALGWSEWSLHLGMLPIAVLTAIGFYRLAVRMTNRPLMAALAGVLTPAFLVSSTQVMCDVLMLGLWLWSVDLWIQGVKEKRAGLLVLSAVLASAASLAKYFGIALVPLLFLYLVLAKPRFWPGYVILLFPLAALGIYDWRYHQLYDLHPLSESAKFTRWFWFDRKANVFSSLLTTASFLGGAVASPAILAFFRGPKRALAGAGIGFVSALVVVAAVDRWVGLNLAAQVRLPVGITVQLCLFVTAGTYILYLAIKDVFLTRTPESFLLAAWVIGTFVFAGVMNWTVNVRAVLTAVPAAACLVAREWDRREVKMTVWDWRPLGGLGICGVLALLVATSDYFLARSEKIVAEKSLAAIRVLGRRSWFEGYWGYMYYMLEGGASQLDACSTPLRAGDLLVFPSNQGLDIRIPDPFLHLVQRVNAPLFPLVSTMSVRHSAGFYASFFGRLPFAFGAFPTREAGVFEILRDIEMSDRLLNPDNPK